MTPAERAVVQAAMDWAEFTNDPDGGSNTLYDACLALKAERAGPVIEEQDLTWGQVVVGDEIYSDRLDRWYEVTTTVAMIEKPGHVKIWAKGLPKAIEPKAGGPVRVRRGEMGQAVDILASVVWSGQSSPDPAEPAEPEVSQPDA